MNQTELPPHLRDDALFAYCNACGRKTWNRSEFGYRCGMRQPMGEPCQGTFVRSPLPSPAPGGKINRQDWRCPHCGGYDAGGIELCCSGCGRLASPPLLPAAIDVEAVEKRHAAAMARRIGEGTHVLDVCVADVPGLLARIRELEALQLSTANALSDAQDKRDDLEDDLRTARQSITRLREALKQKWFVYRGMTDSEIDAVERGSDA